MDLTTVNSLADLRKWSLLNHVDHKVVYVIGVLVFFSFIIISITKKLKIPKVVGYVLVGILFSVSTVNRVPFLSGQAKEWYAYLINSFSYVTVLTVSFISFKIGTELSIEVLKKLEVEFALIVFLESIGSFALVTGSMLLLEQPLFLALVLGAIACATAPAATVMVLKEYKAHGELTATLLVVLALDEALAVIIFSFAEPIALTCGAEHMSLTFTNGFLIPLIKVLGAISLGLLAGYFSQKAMVDYHSKVKKVLLLLTTVFGVSAIAIFFHASPLIANLSVGFAYRNFCKRHLGIAEHMDTITIPLYAIFFILAGMQIKIASITSVSFLIIAVTYFVARTIGKLGGSYLGAKLSGAPKKVEKYIGLGLLPQIGVAIDLAYKVERDFAHLAGEKAKLGMLVFNILLFTAAITEILGPLATEYGLNQAGEMKEF
ncbi:cation:proton antiporter [Halanaerobacter jeridensis]|uniref:Kef-type K+ transport system membrane component KefB n=1 Tax=Halanaerobacter jeridensis TaxID=706427 RepID=A0A938XXE5_9FIRM|nr:cation:proton antiporter [Halanaerobacter jeridensis]MBM7557402.1 Kef-type K+ transport system membrane component KefB [Halanaerobacter jeridensis]